MALLRLASKAIDQSCHSTESYETELLVGGVLQKTTKMFLLDEEYSFARVEVESMTHLTLLKCVWKIHLLVIRLALLSLSSQPNIKTLSLILLSS